MATRIRSLRIIGNILELMRNEHHIFAWFVLLTLGKGHGGGRKLFFATKLSEWIIPVCNTGCGDLRVAIDY